MDNLLTLDNVSLAYGLDKLLDQVKFQITSGERVCLIGRNGAGKSSFLKIIAGTLMPDSGAVWRKPHLRIATLAQDLPQDTAKTVYEFVAEGLAETGLLLTAYHALTQRLAYDHSPEALLELERLQHAIDAKDGWLFEQQINAVLTRLELSADKTLAELSGGWQRRAALAKALVSAPELLLLDEPTNHLDIEAIQWLEEELVRSGVALLFITHDRSLLQRLATRIVELDRGQMTSWPGDYDNFLRRKEEMLHAESVQNAEFDKKLAQEERWIRQGIKARRTRNEGRVRALEALRIERAARRDVQGRASFAVNTGDKSGQLVVEAQHITQHFNDRCIINDLSLRIMRGDRIGLIGPNGIGKSTLLNILLGNLTPESGTVTPGTRLQIAYFDQLRKTLEPEKTVLDNVAGGREVIEINGKEQHIISYLGQFLFTPQRVLTPVKALSGGECNRLLLARLFTLPANLLVMDEPTNDLDIETLELLEELLANYQGTLLLVSHDRTFLDNVVTSTLVFEGAGKIREYVGGYQDWLRQRKSEAATPTTSMKPVTHKTKNTTNKKLTYNEQKEFAALPGKIATIEEELKTIQQRISQATFYQQEPSKITETLNHLKKCESQLHMLSARWEELYLRAGDDS